MTLFKASMHGIGRQGFPRLSLYFVRPRTALPKYNQTHSSFTL